MGDAYEWWWVMRYHSEITQKTCRSVPTSLGRTNTIFTWASLCKVSNSLKPIILVTCICTPQRMVLNCECQEHKSKAMNNHETCPKGSNFLKLWSSWVLYISQNMQTFLAALAGCKLDNINEGKMVLTSVSWDINIRFDTATGWQPLFEIFNIYASMYRFWALVLIVHQACRRPSLNFKTPNA